MNLLQRIAGFLCSRNRAKNETSQLPKLIFFHIPRTGGSSLREDLLLKRYHPDTVFFVNHNWNLGLGGSVEKLHALSTAEKKSLRLILGHMPFGVHEELCEPDEWQYVTFLRDPITRAVSEYFLIKNDETNAAYSSVRDMSLEEYVQIGFGHSWNGICRALANQVYSSEFTNDEAMFDVAMANAKRFSFFGFTDEYQHSADRFCDQYGWPRNPVARIHAKTPKGYVLTENEKRLLVEKNEYDLRLYRHFRNQIRHETAA